MNKSIVYYLTLAVSIFYAGDVIGQSTVDSLFTALKKTDNDSLKIRLLIKLSGEYQYIDIGKGMEYAEEAVKIAEDKNLVWAKPKVYSNLASLNSIQGDLASSIKNNNLALNLNFQLKDSLSIATCYNNLGTDYYSLGKYDEAYFYHTQSYNLANSVKGRDSRNAKLKRAISLHNIASVFKELGQYDRALDYFKLSMKLSEEIQDLEGAPYNYSEIGDLYMKQGKYDSALTTLKLSLRLTRERKLSINEVEPGVLIDIAKTYMHLKDNEAAVRYYDSASILFTKTDNQFGLAQVSLGRGLLFMQEKKYAEAQKLIEKSAEVAHRLNARTLEIECYQNLSMLLEEKGDYQKSLSYFKHQSQIKDSLFSQGMQAKLLQDQIQFETASKEEQIKALTKMEQLGKDEVKKQELISNILVVAVALTVILLFTVYRSGQRRIKINKLLLEHQDDIKKRSIELEQLNQVKDKFFSIISHDLRSPMNALSGILDLMDKDRISPEEFSKLNKELRIQFNHTKTLINNLLDWTLLQMDKLKIQMEKIELSSLIDTNVKLLTSLHFKEVKINNLVTPQTLALGDTNMINLVLRNLLTNAIKFSEAGDLIEVASKEEGASIIISVTDHGVGMSPAVQKLLFEKTAGYSTRGTANEKGTGLGLILCKEFVERNGGKIWLESEEGKGSTFYFTVKKFS